MFESLITLDVSHLRKLKCYCPLAKEENGVALAVSEALPDKDFLAEEPT